ncbi:hypothetical protein BDW67DRAFT_167090 [Aspergillus spinulosporus]
MYCATACDPARLQRHIYHLHNLLPHMQSSRKMHLCLSCSCDPLEGNYPYDIVTWLDLCILCICYCSFCGWGICWGADKCAWKSGLIRSRSGSKSRSRTESRHSNRPRSHKQSQQQQQQ